MGFDLGYGFGNLIIHGKKLRLIQAFRNDVWDAFWPELSVCPDWGLTRKKGNCPSSCDTLAGEFDAVEAFWHILVTSKVMD